MDFSSVCRLPEEDWEVLEDCYVHKVTDRAILVTYEGEQFWVPKSQVDDAALYPRWWQGDMTVRGWFARKAGML